MDAIDQMTELEYTFMWHKEERDFVFLDGSISSIVG